MSKVVYETEWARYRLDELRIGSGAIGIWLPVSEGGRFSDLTEATRVADLCADDNPDMRYRVVDLWEDE